jgi:hypothetical protein
VLKHLLLKNVGPAPEMAVEFGPRINLITGDNGLGKSFLLDVSWWALTRKWPRDLNHNLTSGYLAKPSKIKLPATIEFSLTTKTKKTVEYTSKYSAADESWIGKAGRPWNPGLVIYAHADGSFSVWDPARNYWKQKDNIDVQDRLPGSLSQNSLAKNQNAKAANAFRRKQIVAKISQQMHFLPIGESASMT